jgi:hypothetical protein
MTATIAPIQLPPIQRYSEVEKLCSRAASILLQAPPSTLGRGGSASGAGGLRPVLVAQTMQALALVLMGRPAEAERLARSCLEAAEQQLPTEGPAAAERNRLVASASNCLSEALRELGRLDDAEAACRKGLALREKVGGPTHQGRGRLLQQGRHLACCLPCLRKMLVTGKSQKTACTVASRHLPPPQKAPIVAYLESAMTQPISIHALACSRTLAGVWPRPPRGRAVAAVARPCAARKAAAARSGRGCDAVPGHQGAAQEHGRRPLDGGGAESQGAVKSARLPALNDTSTSTLLLVLDFGLNFEIIQPRAAGGRCVLFD